MARGGCIVECPLGCVTTCQVLGGRHQWAKVSGGPTQARNDGQSRVLPVRDPHVGGVAEAFALCEPVGVCAAWKEALLSVSVSGGPLREKLGRPHCGLPREGTQLRG